jgi:hypothetical protein
MKTERRGRPKNRETLITEGVIQPQKRKYTREFNHADGTKDVFILRDIIIFLIILIEIIIGFLLLIEHTSIQRMVKKLVTIKH